MLLRACLALLMLALAASGGVLAQNRVRTETIRPPPPPPIKYQADGRVVPPASEPGGPAILTDVSRLPGAVASMRERILAAARSGDLEKVVAVMRMSETPPVFAFSADKDPIAFWKATYPDSEGVELLAILATILDTGFVHVDQGTAGEIYLWPYFARMPLKGLTPEQKVELFRIVTGGDYRDMIAFGAYSFYRLGIAPDGTWQFFVSGD